MKKLTLYLTLPLLVSCTSTYDLGHEPGNLKAEKALSDMIDQEVTLTLINGFEDEARLIKWTRDTLVYLKDKSILSLPLDQIYCVKETGSRFLGTLAGLTVGGMIGAGIGEHENDRESGGFIVGLLGGVFGNRALYDRTIVNIAAMDPEAQAARAASQEVIGILVPALSGETDNFLVFSSQGKTISLPKYQLKFERRKDGIMIWATRGTYQSAGLILK